MTFAMRWMTGRVRALFGKAHAVAGWPSDTTRVLASMVHGLSMATTRRRQPLPEALVKMEALLGAVGEVAGGEEGVVVVGAASAVSRPLVSPRGASMPPVREDEPDARAAPSAQPEAWSGGELTRMVRQLEVGDADARKREHVTKAYDSMMVRLERVYLRGAGRAGAAQDRPTGAAPSRAAQRAGAYAAPVVERGPSTSATSGSTRQATRRCSGWCGR